MNTKQQEKLNKIQQEVLDKIIVARVGLLLRHPFFGNMALDWAFKNVMNGVPQQPLMAEIFITTPSFSANFLLEKLNL